MRTITITGTGKVTVKPDLTVVTCSVRSVNKNYEKAVDESNKKLNALNDALQKIGFNREDVKTTSYDVHSEYEGQHDKNGNYKNIFVGYACVHMLKIEFDFDSDRLSKVLSAVSGTIAEPELNVRFSVKDKDKVTADLLRNATESAKRNAGLLAEASGVKLGELMEINYSKHEINVYSPTYYGMNDMAMAKECCANGADIEPDDIEASDSATFIWEII